jgi:hypothetical protein
MKISIMWKLSGFPPSTGTARNGHELFVYRGAPNRAAELVRLHALNPVDGPGGFPDCRPVGHVHKVLEEQSTGIEDGSSRDRHGAL